MKKILLILCGACAFFLTSCDIDKTKDGKMPSIDVDADAGRLPSYDVDWATVNVGTKTKMVKVPKVKVIMEEMEVEVPYVDVDMPGGGDKEERTIIVEAEINGTAAKVNIQEVYATGNRLYVISKLTSTGESLGDETMRVSDRLTLNATDLDIKHFIIGEQPAGAFNRQYTYINSRSDIAHMLKGGKVIFTK